MNRLLDKRQLAPEVFRLEVEAPRIQKRWKAGQFVIIRPFANSERIPLTLVESDFTHGSVTLVIQAVGKTTREAVSLNPGDFLADVVGPLGEPASLCENQRVVCLAGGVGVAEVLPVVKAFRDRGNHVTALCGARSDAYRILDAELRDVADVLKWATDDGSYGFHGNVLQMMQAHYQPGNFDIGHVIGPIPMMKAVAAATRDWGMTKMYASLNPVMIDGTGMCGGCRVTVGKEVKFACVDGPEFDAHQVDFDELARRNRAYREQEQMVLAGHECRASVS
jgi:ferredoxin/flavodoxin---NADP+ reductase